MANGKLGRRCHKDVATSPPAGTAARPDAAASLTSSSGTTATAPQAASPVPAAAAAGGNTPGKDAGGNPAAAATSPPAGAVHAAKPEENAKPPAAGDAAPQGDYFLAAEDAWQALGGPFTLNDLTRVIAKVPNPDQRLRADLVEVQFLRMLAAYLDPQTNPDDARKAVLVRDLAEQAALPAEPRVLCHCRSGETCRSRSPSGGRSLVRGQRRGVERRCRRALGRGTRDRRQGRLCRGPRSGERIQAAYEVRDRVLARLPHLCWLCSRLVKEHAHDPAALVKLLEDARSFAENIDRAIDDYRDVAEVDHAWPAGLEDQQQELDAAEKGLEKLFNAECDELEGLTSVPKNMTKIAFRRLAAALDVPLLTGPRRVEFRRRYVEGLGTSLDPGGGDAKSESTQRIAWPPGPRIRRRWFAT